MLYALACIPAAALPALVGVSGLLYAAGAAAMTAVFVWRAFDLFRRGEHDVDNRAAKKLFGFSIIWLFSLFALILVEKLAGLPAFTAVL